MMQELGRERIVFTSLWPFACVSHINFIIYKVGNSPPIIFQRKKTPKWPPRKNHNITVAIVVWVAGHFPQTLYWRILQGPRQLIYWSKTMLILFCKYLCLPWSIMEYLWSLVSAHNQGKKTDGYRKNRWVLGGLGEKKSAGNFQI